MSTNPETAVSYAALILADEGMEITPDKLQTLLKAANVEIEPIWSTIFAKALADKDIKQILTTVQTSDQVGNGSLAKVEQSPIADQNLGKDVSDDGNGSDSGSDIGMGLFD